MGASQGALFGADSKLWHAARGDGSPVSKLFSPQPPETLTLGPILHTPNILAILVTVKLMEYDEQ